MNEFDVISEAYQAAMEEGDFEQALAISAGLSQAISASAAQEAFEAGLSSGQQQGLDIANAQAEYQASLPTDEQTAEEAYGILFDSLDARKNAVGAERDRQTARKIVDNARGSYSWMVKEGEKNQ